MLKYQIIISLLGSDGERGGKEDRSYDKIFTFSMEILNCSY